MKKMISWGVLSVMGGVLTACGGGGAGGVSNGDLPTSAAMTVYAGVNQSVEAGTPASFVGEAIHENRKIVKVYWSQVYGNPADLIGADCAGVNGGTGTGTGTGTGGGTVAPAALVFNDKKSCVLKVNTKKSLKEERYVFRFTAVDADGNMRYDDVDLRVTPYEPTAPVVDAGMDLEVPPNVDVYKTCTYTGGYWESTPPKPRYAWKVVSTTGSVMPELKAVDGDLRFTSPTEASTSTITIACSVTDDANHTGTDTFTVRVQGLNDLPPLQANAGAARSVAPSAAVTLDASGTKDPSNTGVTIYYLWEQVSGPSVKLANSSSVQASFVAPEVAEATDLVFRVYVDRKPITDSSKASLPSSQKAETVVRVVPPSAPSS